MHVEALLLDDSVQAIPLAQYRGKSWDIVRVGKVGTKKSRIVLDPTADALFLLGDDSRKWSLARHGLLLGKHVFVDLPSASEIRRIRELHALARVRRLRVDSVNLLSAERPIQYLKQLTSNHRLMSITILCGTPQETVAAHVMKLARMIDMCEWLANSKCRGVLAETTHRGPKASVALLNLRNNVRVLVNVYQCSRVSRRMQVEAVFEDAFAIADPYAQAVSVSDSKGRVSSFGWRPSTLPSVLDAFVKETGMRPSTKSRDEERCVTLSRRIVAQEGSAR